MLPATWPVRFEPDVLKESEATSSATKRGSQEAAAAAAGADKKSIKIRTR